jgi:hypothetical protein
VKIDACENASPSHDCGGQDEPRALRVGPDDLTSEIKDARFPECSTN